VEVKVYTTAELRPVRSAVLVAPPVSGTLQIVKLANPALPVKQGDVVVQFDTTEQEFKLEQARFDVQAAEQKIIKSNADAAVQAAEDKLALLSARFAVRRAELDVSRNELLSAIDAKKNNLALAEAKRKLAQLEDDVKSREVSNRAALAVVQEAKAKALLDMQQAQQAIDRMRITAPFGGMVSIKENRGVFGGMFFTGMVVPEYREGDLTRSGTPIAEILDGTMELQSKIAESDRGNITVGQPVDVQVDAMPGKRLHGEVKTIASLASHNFWEADSQRKFDAAFEIKDSANGLRPGETAHVVIAAADLHSVLFIPAQAVFDKDGRPVVYVKHGTQFKAQDVKVLNRSEDRVVVDGLAEGTEIALANPDVTARPNAKPGTAAPTLGGGAGR
jgi:multidrug resistance efflux pump